MGEGRNVPWLGDGMFIVLFLHSLTQYTISTLTQESTPDKAVFLTKMFNVNFATIPDEYNIDVVCWEQH